jgi:Protein of unknown function (DUF962)
VAAPARWSDDGLGESVSALSTEPRTRAGLHPLLTLAQHLAIYTAFHQSPRNRALHALGVPLVLLSGLVLLAYAPGVGVVVSVALFGVFARLDLRRAMVLGLLGLMGAGLAAWVVDRLPSLAVVPCALVLHASAWFVLTVVGHVHCEPRLLTSRGAVDSNEYFRRRLFLARNLGVEANLADAVVQFCISPMAAMNDWLELFGVHGPEKIETLWWREAFLAEWRLHVSSSQNPG